ncbi:unnamed protein product [Brachionus calyciflorus]|uniref:Uncharacterized protein n=1 Tax=Brachionus calyciflorus TaxID=104777 RepID=A0A814GJ67_9BILA|nr:unnamed protein product [Brachionus calyciflorus]
MLVKFSLILLLNLGIVLDSDKDKQDRKTISDVPASKKEVDYNRSGALSRQKKDKRVATFINDSNRSFTNRNNIFLWENYMRDSSIFIMDAKKQDMNKNFINNKRSLEPSPSQIKKRNFDDEEWDMEMLPKEIIIDKK